MSVNLFTSHELQDSLRQKTCDFPPTTSCFDRLPTELKVEVFEQCLDPYPRLQVQAAPLMMCRVCPSWRNIVRSSPKLWAQFEVIIPSFASNDPTEDQNRMKALGLWLELSRTSLMSFQVSQELVGHSLDPRLVQVLAALIPHVHRWKDASFGMQSSGMELLRHIAPEDLMALRFISVDLKGPYQTPFDVQAPVIPWRQIISLNLSFDYGQLLTLDECLVILVQCDNLKRCTLNVDCAFDPRASKARVALPRLVQFELVLQSGPHVDANDARAPASSLMFFLEQLKLSNLPSFSVQWLVNRSAWTWAVDDQSRFISILASLAPSLRSLKLAYLPFSDQDLLQCLQHLQGLSHLDLRFSLADKEHDPITDAFLIANTSSTDIGPPEYLPVLRSLHLQSHGARCTALRVMDLIQSRCNSSGDDRLQSFGLLSLVPISSAKMQEMLRAWSREGLDIAIKQMLIR
ncbi:hypothetical protein H0H87_004223 [Tephrocybe sp. NHM501043]|nr:hypothetical protein H0H87_004223 [Tephrocybe sp. NHM501043]